MRKNVPRKFPVLVFEPEEIAELKRYMTNCFLNVTNSVCEIHTDKSLNTRGLALVIKNSVVLSCSINYFLSNF